MSVGYESLELSNELLTADDVAAICTEYPPGAQLDCPTVHAPAYDECQQQPGDVPACQLVTMKHETDGGGGCSIGGAAPSKGSGGWATLLVGLLWCRRLLRASAASKRTAAPAA